MKLFIGNLSQQVTEFDLRDFFKGFDKQATFKIVHMQEMVQGDGEEDLVYGLVSIESERLARKAIKKLNYKKLNHRVIIVREFQHRASQNDKRALNWRMQQWIDDERRGRERRKSRKIVQNLEDIQVTGNKNFSRKYD